jgi:hypothetical protein
VHPVASQLESKQRGLQARTRLLHGIDEVATHKRMYGQQ